MKLYYNLNIDKKVTRAKENSKDKGIKREEYK